MIRLLQDAAGRGEIDPWDIDVISVIDSFLDQLNQRIPWLNSDLKSHNKNISFEKHLADSSEVFFAASVLVSLKADILEAETFESDSLEDDSILEEIEDQQWLHPDFELPKHPEKYLRRRSFSPPEMKRSATLGELISQLESIAEYVESQDLQILKKKRSKRFSERELISQVTSLAHRETLPETTAALEVFISSWELALQWVDFEFLIKKWRDIAKPDLDTDRVGVFWALLFLYSQNKISMEQEGSLYGPLRIKRILPEGFIAQLPFENLEVNNASPTAA